MKSLQSSDYHPYEKRLQEEEKIKLQEEQVRLKEDIGLWKLRQKVMNENFQDNQSCVKEKEEILIDRWFPDGKIPMTDLWNLFNPRKDKDFADN